MREGDNSQMYFSSQLSVLGEGELCIIHVTHCNGISFTCDNTDTVAYTTSLTAYLQMCI